MGVKVNSMSNRSRYIRLPHIVWTTTTTTMPACTGHHIRARRLKAFLSNHNNELLLKYFQISHHKNITEVFQTTKRLKLGYSNDNWIHEATSLHNEVRKVRNVQRTKPLNRLRLQQLEKDRNASLHLSVPLITCSVTQCASTKLMSFPDVCVPPKSQQ